MERAFSRILRLVVTLVWVEVGVRDFELEAWNVSWVRRWATSRIKNLVTPNPAKMGNWRHLQKHLQEAHPTNNQRWNGGLRSLIGKTHRVISLCGLHRYETKQ